MMIEVKDILKHPYITGCSHDELPEAISSLTRHNHIQCRYFTEDAAPWPLWSITVSRYADGITVNVSRKDDYESWWTSCNTAFENIPHALVSELRDMLITTAKYSHDMEISMPLM